MKLLKIAGASIGALVVAWAGASYYVGGIIEDSFEAQLITAAESPFMDISITRLERGVFSSEIEITFTMDATKFVGKTDLTEDVKRLMNVGPVAIQYEVRHGPLVNGPKGLEIAAATFEHNALLKQFLVELGWVDEATSETLTIADDYGILTSAIINFDGTAVSSVTAGPLEFDLELEDSTMRFEWAEMTFESTYQTQDQRVAINANLPLLRITEDRETRSIDMNLVGLSVDMEINILSAFVQTGTTSFELDEFTVSSEETGNTFTISGMAVNVIALEDEIGLLDYAVDFKVTSISVAEGEHSGSFDWVSDYNNLPPGAYQTYQKASFDLAADADNPAAAEAVLNALKQMASANPEFNITKGVITYNGGTMNYTQELRADTADGVPEDQEGWLAATVYRGTIIADEVMARLIARQTLISQLGENAANVSEEQIEQGIQNTITQMMTGGMVTREGDDYRIDMAIDNGIMSLGGTPVVDIRTQLPGDANQAGN